MSDKWQGTLAGLKGDLEEFGATWNSEYFTINKFDAVDIINAIDALEQRLAAAEAAIDKLKKENYDLGHKYAFAVRQCISFTEKLYEAKILGQVFVTRWKNEWRYDVDDEFKEAGDELRGR